METWFKTHSAALVALAGALGVAGGSLGLGTPGVEAALQEVGAVVGIVGAVVHAYVQGAKGSSKASDVTLTRGGSKREG